MAERSVIDGHDEAVGGRGRRLAGTKPYLQRARLVATDWVRSKPVDMRIAAVLVLLAAIFRVHGISAQSLWLDEIGEATTARLPLDALFASVKGDAAATPLDYLGVRVVTGVLGTGTTATRLWALAVGCLAVAAVYFTALRLFKSRRAAVLSAIVLITSPFAIYFSQEARFYSLTMLVSALSILAFLRAWEMGGVAAWLAFAGAGALVLYTHYFAAAVLFSTQAAFTIVASIITWLRSGRSRTALRSGARRISACAMAMIIAFALFGPWLLYATLPELGRIYQVPLPPPLDATQVITFLTEIFGGLVPSEASWLTGAVMVAASAGALRAIVNRRGEVAILLAATVVAIPVAWLADTHAHYFWTSRQVAFMVPLVCILAGGGLWSFGQLVLAVSKKARGSSMAQGGLVVILGVAWLLVSWSPIQRVYAGDIAKDDWRGVTRLVATTACADARFFVNIPDHYQFGIGYYDSSLIPRSQFLPPRPQGLADYVAGLPFGPHDWLIVLTYAPGTGSIDAMSSRMAAAGWTEHVFVSIRAFERGSSCQP